MQTIKQIQMPQWLVRTLLIGLGIIFVVLPVHAFISTWGGTAIGPLWLWKSWKEVLLVVLTGLVVWWMISRPESIKGLYRKPLVVAIGLYLLWSLVFAALNWRDNGLDATLAGLAMNLRYLGAATLAYLVFRYGGLSSLWLDRAFRYVMIAGVTVAIMGILQVLIVPGDALSLFGYDKATTIAPSVVIDNNPELLRAFATLRGPNDFGAFLILPILIAISYARRLPIWVTVTMMTFLFWALALSGSRSAWLGTFAALVVYSGLTFRTRISHKHIAALGVGGLLLLTGILYASVTVPALRAAVFHSSPGDPTLTEGSTDNHIAATLGGLERVVNEPLGCGPGCAGPASYYGNDPKISENYWVQIAEEVGVLGLTVLIAALFYTALTLYRNAKTLQQSRLLLASLAGYIVIGLFLHVWADDPLSITWWLLAGAVIGYNESDTWKKSKANSRSKTSSSL